jgi:serine/threonine protein kinase
MLTELKLLTDINSPFICSAHYAFQDPTHIFLVLDLATGGDLRYNLSRQPAYRFQEEVAKFFAVQLIFALQ